MKKIAVVGVYGTGPDFTTGQAVKCHTIIDWLIKKYGYNQIEIVNTYKWKKNPFNLLCKSICAEKKCRNIIIMPAQHGVKVFAPLYYYLNKHYGRQIHYVVIGGWLAEMLEENPHLVKIIKSFSGVYVETYSMKNKLEAVGLENVFYMPNSREYVPKQVKKGYNESGSIKICTYSRVVREKGIFDAVTICKMANEKLNKAVFSLDIYGKISDDFREEFENILSNNSDVVCYCGCKNSEETIITLGKYYAMLFPTYYEGEGFAGTVLDAFSAELPIVANDWKYNSEIIKDRVNGIIYPFRNLDYASNALVELYENIELYQTIQEGCRVSASLYSTDNVMTEFVSRLQ